LARQKGGLCVSLEAVRGASTTPSRDSHDDVAASQPEARGGCRPIAVSPSPRFSLVGSFPQTTSCSDVWSTMTEMNKLSQLSIFVSFTLRVTYLGFIPVIIA
jgi:hypothetical protein